MPKKVVLLERSSSGALRVPSEISVLLPDDDELTEKAIEAQARTAKAYLGAVHGRFEGLAQWALASMQVAKGRISIPEHDGLERMLDRFGLHEPALDDVLKRTVERAAKLGNK